MVAFIRAIGIILNVICFLFFASKLKICTNKDEKLGINGLCTMFLISTVAIIV